MFRAGVAGLMSVVLVVRCYKYRYLRFGVRVGVDVWCYILYYILYYILLLYYYYILYYTLSYTILFFCPSSSHSSDLPSVLSSSSLLSSPPILLPSSLLLIYSSHSFYTCRYLHILIYIPDSSTILTPHVLSEWMVEVCRFDEYRCSFQEFWCFDGIPVFLVFRSNCKVIVWSV